MERLKRAGSNDEPAIDLNPETGVLYFGGSSLPENVLEVYKPVVDWLNHYIPIPYPKTRVEFHFHYLNTASSHMIMQLMEKFLALKSTCEELQIIWYYDKADADMRDFGEELGDLTGLPVELVGEERD